MRRCLSSSPTWAVLFTSAIRPIEHHTRILSPHPHFLNKIVPSQLNPLTSQPGRFYRPAIRAFSSLGDGSHAFKPGDKVKVEVVSFGPLGASVEVIGIGHGDVAKESLKNEDDSLARGLIFQQEIAYFREARNNVDVVRGEVLSAYVQSVREDGKLDVGLRAFGGRAKAQEVGTLIMERLNWTPEGSIPIGDKSSPREINREFPGVSKSAFKKALGALYKKGLVQPSATSITLLKKPNQG